jgi:glycine/D-amino acid oxidase-like deaminating enzyme
MSGVRIPPDQGRSWWLRECLSQPACAGDPAPALAVDTQADVVILGGGFTGLWSAWFLKELDPAVDVVILEQDICGGGPSGRNGGFVTSFWGSLPHLTADFGDVAAVRLCQAGEDSVRSIGTWLDDHGIDAWYRYDGDLGVASAGAQVGEWADLIITADRLGLGDLFQVLSTDEVRTLVDSPVFLGGVLGHHGATVHPARLARGLRNALIQRGVRIYEGSPVQRFGAGDPVHAQTPMGTVTAGQGIVALNAWAQHWKRFRRALTVRGSYIVITEPAPERLDALGWTDGMGVWDHRAALHYVRTTPDGRLAFGIGGMQPDLARTIDDRYAYDAASIQIAIEDLHRMFPAFAGVGIEAGWGGPIDVSGDHEPFFGTFESGTVHYGLGYTGNGVGPAHLGGQILAHRALGRYSEVLELPLVDLEPKRFPPDPIRSAGMFMANHAIHRRDRAHDQGLEPNPFTDFVAKLPRRLGYNLGP